MTLLSELIWRNFHEEEQVLDLLSLEMLEMLLEQLTLPEQASDSQAISEASLKLVCAVMWSDSQMFLMHAVDNDILKHFAAILATQGRTEDIVRVLQALGDMAQ